MLSEKGLSHLAGALSGGKSVIWVWYGISCHTAWWVSTIPRSGSYRYSTIYLHLQTRDKRLELIQLGSHKRWLSISSRMRNRTSTTNQTVETLHLDGVDGDGCELQKLWEREDRVKRNVTEKTIKTKILTGIENIWILRNTCNITISLQKPRINFLNCFDPLQLVMDTYSSLTES